jgi:hypothetical protein
VASYLQTSFTYWNHIFIFYNYVNNQLDETTFSLINLFNFVSVVSLFVLMVWLINDTPDSLMADTTVSASVEWIVKYTIHKFSLVVSVMCGFW